MASNDVITKADIEGLKVYIDGRIKSVEDRMTGVESRLSGIEGRIMGVENRITGVESRLTEATSEIKTEVRVNAVKIEEVKNSLNWDFATLTIVVTLVGFVITLAQMFREMFKEKRRERNDDEIRGIFREEFAKLKEEA